MKTLFIECSMGAAGDMLMAALLELVEDPALFLQQLNGLGIRNVCISAKPAIKCGINGTQVSVTVGQEEEASADIEITDNQNHTHCNEKHHHHKHDHNHSHDHKHDQLHTHHHTGMSEIKNLLASLPVSQCIKEHALAVYNLIAEAESHVHGCPVEEIHFHEVGNLDAVTDILGVCMLMEQLVLEQVVVSPIHIGSGFVRCAHGILPVPAPATAHILQNIPVYGGKIKGELCTPTGAALVRHFANHFGPMPEMYVHKIGYGMGKKDFEAANCVRVFLGESEAVTGKPNGEAAELRCNVDDMTGEQIGFACQMLMEAGAYDVFTTSVQMKKNRPGTLITCVCSVEKADLFAGLLLKHTTTFGVRKSVYSRYVLQREVIEHGTPYGKVGVKSGDGYGIRRSKLEYDDIAALTMKNGLSIDETERRIWAHLQKREDEKDDNTTKE